jgi:hypothetical protein
MKQLNSIALGLSLTLLLGACSKKQETATTDSTATATGVQPQAAASAPATAGKYKVKSGIVTTEMDNPLGKGAKMTSVLYFDDYGKIEATELKNEMEMMGQKIKTHEIEIRKDGYMYKIDLEKKTATKFKFNPGNGASGMAAFASLDMSSQQAKDMNMKKEASQTIAGKECDVYSMDAKKMGMKGTVAMWQGIPMKVDADMSGMKVHSNVVKIEENVAMPAGIFDVPAGIEVKEVAM